MIEFKEIGVIHSPFVEESGMPIQPAGAKDIKGTVEVFDEYVEGLMDLDGFSHIILLYYFHRVSEAKLQVVPFLDTRKHGVFATRAPKRPNPLGLSVVKLISIEGNKLFIENVDVIDGTPLIDIKPYVPEFDNVEKIRVGWLEEITQSVQNKRADTRFKK
jgi:tRNA-Thr(GGU) m(6)t(6)A37 methyltransferase TsaA